MSELKAVHAFDVYEAYTKTGDDDAAQVYLKSEADNAISTIRAERDEYRYNLSCARNEIHNLSMSMREDVKRIADKDKVIDELKAKLKVQTSNAEEAWKLKDSYHTDYSEAVEELFKKNKQLRHHKFKRCLAMAERCKYRMYYLAAVVEQEASKIIPLKAQMQWYQKRESRMDYWKNRWLELAEKFKEEYK